MCCVLHEGEYRLSVGARPARAMLLLDDQHLLDEELSEDSVEAFAGWAKIRIPTGSNLRGSAAYRSRLVGVVCKPEIIESVEGDVPGMNISMRSE